MVEDSTVVSSRGRAEKTSNAILQAADVCFARFGITKTTMDDVAREAGVSRPTVYRNFATRDDLISGVVQSRARDVQRHARTFVESRASIDDAIVDGLIHLVDIGRRDPMVFQLVSLEFTEIAKGVETPRLIVDLTYEFWSPLLKQAMASGEIRADLDVRRFCAWLTFVELVLSRRLSRVPPDDPALRRDVRQFVLPALHRRTPPPAPAGAAP